MVLVSLANCNKHDIGIIRQISELQMPQKYGLISGDIEARLLEMGFIEGARVVVLHLGMWGRDPIAVRIDNSNSVIALRKNEAAAILLEKVNNE